MSHSLNWYYPGSAAIKYTAAERGPAIEGTLALYSWDGSRWVKEPTSTLNIATHTIGATPSHFSVWAVLGEAQRYWLPLARR